MSATGVFLPTLCRPDSRQNGLADSCHRKRVSLTRNLDAEGPKVISKVRGNRELTNFRTQSRK